ncbi:MAG: transcriptional regulator [Bacteroidetes bacterium CG02_land_8_20_14_3_00_31_25]|nr:helix-turn-helix transcriptional regulator [Bacteroidota bacterium]PIV58206.1 MAG: transcriptional regulator [Bacteroidetes bacterium CG02_land_8_20_14_3_00_31_25]PIX34802.1 MAG: transcriptional regulator [Bacteroidetes bacterium CG_4_8_14_3_um_filter_31_14]PIY04836.1 MAG: transcriptional regulator [Bacteroidetes bacterium CG_4_10_14_3_um_filter_31_20]
MQLFGEIIRKLREERELPLRKVAAILDTDQSLLSKIERNERRASKVQVIQLAKIFKVNEKNLLVQYYSDKVAYDLIEEKTAKEILQVAEQKIDYIRKKKK